MAEEVMEGFGAVIPLVVEEEEEEIDGLEALLGQVGSMEDGWFRNSEGMVGGPGVMGGLGEMDHQQLREYKDWLEKIRHNSETYIKYAH
jgi:hypothetical protein